MGAEFALILKPKKAVDRLFCVVIFGEGKRKSAGLKRVLVAPQGCAEEAGSSPTKRQIEPTQRHSSLSNVTPQQHQEKGYVKMPLPIRNVVSPLHSVL